MRRSQLHKLSLSPDFKLMKGHKSYIALNILQYVVNVSSDIALCEEHLGSLGKHLKQTEAHISTYQ